MKKTLIPLLATGLIAASLPVLSSAQVHTPASAETRVAEGRSMMGHHAHAGMMQSGMKHDRGSPQRWMQGLDLSEAQRDRVFEIMHAQAPKMREQRKAVQAARAELAKLSTAAQLDANQLQAASTKLAQAMASMSADQVRTRNAIFQLLTPEQKQKVEARIAERPGHGHTGGHGMRGHGAGHGHGPAHSRS